MIDRNRTKPVSLYLHFPFCERKCRYCDFLSGPASEEERDNYIDLLCREIRLRAFEVPGSVDTIFMGGGTPSIMTPAQLQALMNCLRETFQILPDAEISMEVNPGTADGEKLRAFRESGVNRLSIGVQSFDDAELRLLGRIHTSQEAREIFHAAREAGFTNLNLDLMSALPGQKMETWAHTLREAVALGPEHLSAYSLIIEEGTPFASMQLPALPSEEEDRAMYHFTKQFLSENGYRRYEISNYAREGYACKHNGGYWTGHDYLGLGLGASSLMGSERFKNPDRMEAYRKAVLAGDCMGLRQERELLSQEDQMEEFMFLGLRMTDGVSVEEYQRRFGEPVEKRFGEVIEKHLRQGLICRKTVEVGGASLHCGVPCQESAKTDGAIDHRLALTEYGLDVANYVMADYIL